MRNVLFYFKLCLSHRKGELNWRLSFVLSFFPSDIQEEDRAGKERILEEACRLQSQSRLKGNVT